MSRVLVLPCVSGVAGDYPAGAIPADGDGHADAELAVILAEHRLLLAVDEDAEATDVHELAGHRATLLAYGGWGFLLVVEAEYSHDKLYAFFSPRDFPHMPRLLRLLACEVPAFNTVCSSDFLDLVTADAKRDSEVFFCHSGMIRQETYDTSKIPRLGIEPRLMV